MTACRLSLVLALAFALTAQGARFRANQEAVKTTVNDEELPKELLKAMGDSARAANVRGGPLPKAFGGADDHDPSTTSLIGGKEPKEMLEAWKNKGLATVENVSWSAAAKNAFDNDFTTASYEKLLKDFVGSAESRFIFNKGNAQAREFIVQNMGDSLGKSQVSLQDFKVDFGSAENGGQPRKAVNVIGRLEGKERPKEYVVLGAHYDSVPYTGVAPGADDNGSGVASLLLAAKALAKWPHERTIVFVSFSGEEEGLLGSRAYVKDLAEKDRENFKGAIILDQVGFQKDKSAAASMIFETKGNEDPKQRIVDTMALTAKSALPRAEFKVNYHGWGSDHMPFLEAGLPAVLLIERDNLYSAEHFGHSPKDTLDNIDYDFGAKVAKLAAASIANLASPEKKGAGDNK